MSQRRKSIALYASVSVLVILVGSWFILNHFRVQYYNDAIEGERGFYPPSVYMRSFLACVPDAPCVRIDKFKIEPVPAGCCILIVTNGDGRGTDEVRSYEVFLNGDRVVAADHSRSAHAAVKLLPTNTIKVVLSGAPHSNVFVLLAYDPRRSK